MSKVEFIYFIVLFVASKSGMLGTFINRIILIEKKIFDLVIVK